MMLCCQSPRALGCFCSALLVAAGTAAGAAPPGIFLTMDDLDRQSVDGLVHPSGVSFGFTVGGFPDLDAEYNAEGPGTTLFIDDPSIEGDAAGVLEVDLPAAFSNISFGLAVSDSLEYVVSVDLFDASDVLIEQQPLTLSTDDQFAEAQFQYSGIPVSRFTVDVSPAAEAGRFAFDNLRAIPEPGSMTIALLAVGAFVGWRRHHAPAVGCNRS